MSRRSGPPTFGSRFLGNTNKMEVHDLDAENVQCQIDEIIAANHAVTFNPDELSNANSSSFDNCHYCIGGSKR